MKESVTNRVVLIAIFAGLAVSGLVLIGMWGGGCGGEGLIPSDTTTTTAAVTTTTTTTTTSTTNASTTTTSTTSTTTSTIASPYAISGQIQNIIFWGVTTETNVMKVFASTLETILGGVKYASPSYIVGTQESEMEYYIPIFEAGTYYILGGVSVGTAEFRGTPAIGDLRGEYDDNKIPPNIPGFWENVQSGYDIKNGTPTSVEVNGNVEHIDIIFDARKVSTQPPTEP